MYNTVESTPNPSENILLPKNCLVPNVDKLFLLK